MKTLLTATMALGFFVMTNGNQSAKAWGYDPNYHYPNSCGYAYSYFGYPGCGEARSPYVTCPLICRHDFLGNPYNCHPVCY